MPHAPRNASTASSSAAASPSNRCAHPRDLGAAAVVRVVVHEQAAGRVKAVASAEQQVDRRVRLHDPLEPGDHPAVHERVGGAAGELQVDAGRGVREQVGARAGAFEAGDEVADGDDGLRSLRPVLEARVQRRMQPKGQVRLRDAPHGVVADRARVEQGPFRPAEQRGMEQARVVVGVGEAPGEIRPVEGHEHVAHVEHHVRAAVHTSPSIRPPCGGSSYRVSSTTAKGEPAASSRDAAMTPPSRATRGCTVSPRTAARW